jgi:hypothetical protein
VYNNCYALKSQASGGVVCIVIVLFVQLNHVSLTHNKTLTMGYRTLPMKSFKSFSNMFSKIFEVTHKEIGKIDKNTYERVPTFEYPMEKLFFPNIF